MGLGLFFGARPINRRIIGVRRRINVNPTDIIKNNPRKP
jgi:hypothetical protein